MHYPSLVFLYHWPCPWRTNYSAFKPSNREMQVHCSPDNALGLSTRALNWIHWIPIPHLDSTWSCVSSTRHTDCAHCTAGLDLMHCQAAQQASWIRIEVVWRQSGPWIWTPYPHGTRIQGPIWRAPVTDEIPKSWAVVDLVTLYYDIFSLFLHRGLSYYSSLSVRTVSIQSAHWHRPLFGIISYCCALCIRNW